MNILFYVVITCLLCISSFFEGERTSYERYAIEVQEVQNEHAKNMAIAEAHGKQIEAGLLAEVQENEKNRLEKRNAIEKSTHGTACLNADTVRLLHDADTNVFAMPNTAPVITEADAIATHIEIRGSNTEPTVIPYTPAVTTDTEVANWALDMDALYYECRIRLDALITWHEGIDK